MVNPGWVALAGIQERGQVLEVDLSQVPNQNSGRSMHALVHGSGQSLIGFLPQVDRQQSTKENWGLTLEADIRKQLVHYTIKSHVHCIIHCRIYLATRLRTWNSHEPCRSHEFRYLAIVTFIWTWYSYEQSVRNSIEIARTYRSYELRIRTNLPIVSYTYIPIFLWVRFSFVYFVRYLFHRYSLITLIFHLALTVGLTGSIN
jgi:hypothetical protein